MTLSIDQILDIIHASRMIAIVRLNDLSAAIDLSRALLDGGVRALEFTLTNPDAIKAMTQVKAALLEFARDEAVFPARSGGPRYFTDVHEPLPFLRLIPTGGIDLENVGAYLENGAFAVGLGGNLVNKQLIAARDWAALTDLASEYLRVTHMSPVTRDSG